MRVFLTGATGFIGSFLVPELINAGHRVVGLSRSQVSSEVLTRAGVEVFHGNMNELDRLRAAAEAADGVIHAAFNQDFSNMKQNSEDDRKVIEALGDVLLGSERPFIVTSGTDLAPPSKISGSVVETDHHFTSAEFPRAASEEAADALVAKGGRVMVMRLAQVHDAYKRGRIAWLVQTARQRGRVAYVGDGTNRLPAVHVCDVVRLFRLALEKGQAGARYNAVAEEGVALRDIAAVLGAGLKLPIDALTPEEAPGYFGWMTRLVMSDLAASSEWTRRQLGWEPTGPGLLDDLRNMDYGVV